MISNPGRFGLDLEGLHPPLAFESARISKQVSLKDVAKILAVSPGSIEALNPELRLKVTPPAPYDLKVPIGKGDLLLAKLPGASGSKSSPKTHPVHRVQRGETLGQLAGRYHTSVQAIADLNHLTEKDLLRLGQELKIPLEGKTVAKEAEAEPEIITAGSPEPRRYRVKKGDTLRKIVEDYQTNFDEIMRLNHLETTNFRIDQVLLIPPGNHCGSAGRTSSGSCRRNEGI